MLQLAGVLLFQRAITVALSGYNACFFFSHARRNPRRRLGAVVLGFVNVALGGESLAFGLLPHLSFLTPRSFTVVSQLIVTSLSLAVALAMALLALRHRRRGGR